MEWLIETEKAIIQKVREGDPQAFEILYAKYHTYVNCLCLRFISDTRISEDLCQDIFVKVWKKIHTFRGASRFKTWLHRIAMNTVYMHFRLQKNRPPLHDTNLPGRDERTVEDRVSVSPSYLTDHRLLCQTMSVLRPSYRAILKLHDIAGYKHEEIAKILRIPSGTSKSHLHRARRQIRDMIEKPQANLMMRERAA